MKSDARAPQPIHDLAVGQVVEWLVWTHLVAGSDGDLHVFLPLDDRGVDGIVHRISTDTFARVQVKGLTEYFHRGIRVDVHAQEAMDDEAFLIAVRVDMSVARLGPYALLVDMATYRRIAHHAVHRRTEVYRAFVTMPAAESSVWARWCIPLDEVGDRLLPSSRESAIPAPRDWTSAERLGVRAEMEFLSRAAESPRTNVFKAFPDLEPNEYVLYDVVSRAITGIQVKSVTIPAGAQRATLNVYRPALRPSSQTWFVILLEKQGGAPGFLPDCAVVPSHALTQMLRSKGIHGKLHVYRRMTGRLAPWKVPLAELGLRLAALGSMPL